MPRRWRVGRGGTWRSCGDEGGALYGHADESLFTDPQLARDFVDRTGIDALAVAIGNAHGKYKGEPKLDFPRLDAIRQQTALPLVLHGGSGISDEDFRRAITLGIHKINFYTGMSQAALAAVESRMANRQPLYDEFAELLLGIEEAITDTVSEQMRIFGSAGQI
ncbi:sugar-bisphosphate aldolase [Citrobacter koseri]|uniref:Sugar-bisphosphate aldolase n=1 Tax=Citrobacter koseri TaxID=545 RepID=A0A447UPE2_CITKO|nr:sugar-bisphosphate aldolase [Citrobacter koseri]